MGQEKNAENIPFLRSTQPKSTERVPVVELSGYHREVNPLPDLATRERYSRSQQSITKVMVTISPFRNLNSRPSEHQR